jgi:hypothetical protein
VVGRAGIRVSRVASSGLVADALAMLRRPLPKIDRTTHRFHSLDATRNQPCHGTLMSPPVVLFAIVLIRRRTPLLLWTFPPQLPVHPLWLRRFKMRENNMTAISRVLAAIVVLYSGDACFAAEIKESLSVVVQALATTLKRGGDVILYATTTNLSDTAVSISATISRSTDFFVKMALPGGQFKSDLYYPNGGHANILLKSGDENRSKIFLSKSFNMKEVGEYVITVSPVGSDSQHDFKPLSWSDPITITITE